MLERQIMHVDMDAFFASIEQRDHPKYRGRPVVVGAQPGHRGVVATCSYEARVFGIRSAMPISEAFQRCPHAVYLRPDMARYAAASKQVMAILNGISPVVETVSIDEAYVDITGLGKLIGDAEAIGRRAKGAIEAGVKITASVGIGPNRLIAKLASDMQKPDGLTVVLPHQVMAFLAPLPVSRLGGVGPKTFSVLERMGIFTVRQLQGASTERLQRQLGKRSACRLYNQARGLASDVVASRESRKSISKECTFGEDVSEGDMLRETLRGLATEVGYIARREGLRGLVVTLKLRLEGFETHTRSCKLDEATNSDHVIFQTGWSLYSQSGYAGRPVRLIGIGLSRWQNERRRQLGLFAQLPDRKREECLYAVLDNATKRFGKGALKLGLQKKERTY